ncbi:hypothetical protein BaRGS_00010925, partial [Batillaria attramentaria]
MKTSLVNSSLSDVDELATQYNTTLKSLLDKHAPETEKRVTHRPDTSWFSEDVHEEKRKKHHAERVWRHTRLEVHRQLYRSARNRYNKAVKSAKSDFIVNSLSTSDPRRLYSIVNNLLVMVNIINISLATGIVPTSFKRAVVQPLIKKAGLDPSACKNFRPVSNLPFISKLLERIVAEQLVQHLS